MPKSTYFGLKMLFVFWALFLCDFNHFGLSHLMPTSILRLNISDLLF